LSAISLLQRIPGDHHTSGVVPGTTADSVARIDGGLSVEAGAQVRTPCLVTRTDRVGQHLTVSIGPGEAAKPCTFTETLARDEKREVVSRPGRFLFVPADRPRHEVDHELLAFFFENHGRALGIRKMHRRSVGQQSRLYRETVRKVRAKHRCDLVPQTFESDSKRVSRSTTAGVDVTISASGHVGANERVVLQARQILRMRVGRLDQAHKENKQQQGSGISNHVCPPLQRPVLYDIWQHCRSHQAPVRWTDCDMGPTPRSE
jgi:hypothetical protein